MVAAGGVRGRAGQKSDYRRFDPGTAEAATDDDRRRSPRWCAAAFRRDLQARRPTARRRSTGGATDRRPGRPAGSPTRRNLLVVDGGAPQVAAAADCSPSSASSTSRSAGWPSGWRRSGCPPTRAGDPAAHQRGALPAAADPGRGAPVRDHLSPAEAFQGMTGLELDDVPGLGDARRRRCSSISARCGCASRQSRRSGRARAWAGERRRPCSPRSPSRSRRRSRRPRRRRRGRGRRRGATAATDAWTRHRRQTVGGSDGPTAMAAGATVPPRPRPDARPRPAASRSRRQRPVRGGSSTAAKVPGGPRLVRGRQPAAGADHHDGRSRARRGDVTRFAVVIDVRSRAFTSDLSAVIKDPATPGLPAAAAVPGGRDAALIRRFEPAAARTRCRATAGSPTGSPPNGAAAGRAARPTWSSTPASSRCTSCAPRWSTPFGRRGPDPADVTVLSFGFKYGLPMDSDLVVDMRFLPNPFWIPELRDAHGRDTEVRDYVLAPGGRRGVPRPRTSTAAPHRGGYRREGKRYLTVAVGCTGGKHRSVAMAEELAAPPAGEGSPGRSCTATWAASRAADRPRCRRRGWSRSAAGTACTRRSRRWRGSRPS